MRWDWKSDFPVLSGCRYSWPTRSGLHLRLSAWCFLQEMVFLLLPIKIYEVECTWKNPFEISYMQLSALWRRYLDWFYSGQPNSRLSSTSGESMTGRKLPPVSLKWSTAATEWGFHRSQYVTRLPSLIKNIHSLYCKHEGRPHSSTVVLQWLQIWWSDLCLKSSWWACMTCEFL